MSDQITLDLAGIPFTCRADDLVTALLKKLGEQSKPQAEPIIPNAGEIYAGAITDHGGITTHFFMLTGDFKGNWQDAMAWAKDKGGDLPNRVEQALLFATQKSEFKEEAYWSNTERASGPAYAWCQGFDGGSQLSTRKRTELRARAVRRLIIQ